MTITSLYFLIFLLFGVAIYYITPKNSRWIVLLILSLTYYIFAAEPYTIIFILISALTAYASTKYISNVKKSKAATISAVIGVLINTLIWFLLKGSSFWISTSKLINMIIPNFPVLTPLPFASALGMGYYTAQTIGYILDVYFGTVQFQKNPFKMFLFVCFFPQLIVGPICRHSDFGSVYSGNDFTYENFSFGSQRILWGFFKKLVVADRLAIIINAIWSDTAVYHGAWIWAAVLLFPIQLYADFSGCVDIVLGAAQLFGIYLPENFKSPFFSRNYQEFWQRWHITLGGWARDYVYYPFLKSKKMTDLNKRAKQKYGKKWGKFLPWLLGMAVLWFVMGIWHGSATYILGVSAWSLCVLVLSELTLPLSKKINLKLNINTKSLRWHIFQSARTYVIFSIGTLIFTAAGIGDALARGRALLSSFKNPDLSVLFNGSLFNIAGIKYTDVFVLLASVSLIFIADLLKEKYGSARLHIKNYNIALRWCIWLFLFTSILIFGLYGPAYDASKFIYEAF